MKKKSYNLASTVELVKSGNDFFFDRTYQIIRNSNHTIHLQTYIFADDPTGLETIKHLAEAVKRGVEVYLLVDAFGSHELKSHTIKKSKKVESISEHIHRSVRATIFDLGGGYIIKY